MPFSCRKLRGISGLFGRRKHPTTLSIRVQALSCMEKFQHWYSEDLAVRSSFAALAIFLSYSHFLWQERAESMERVLAVELLHLLATEGAYGAQVAAQLDASEVWHAYRDQKHDLFLPAGGTAQVRTPHPIFIRSCHPCTALPCQFYSI